MSAIWKILMGVLALALAGVFACSKKSQQTPAPVGYQKYFPFEDLSEFANYYSTPNTPTFSDGFTNYTYQDLTKNLDQFAKVGVSAHKAWISQSNVDIAGKNTNHRGYPTIQVYKDSDAANFKSKVAFSFWVYFQGQTLNSGDWISLATITSYADDFWNRTILFNLDYQGIPHLMHIPNQGAKSPDIYQTTTKALQANQWYQVTLQMDFTSTNEYNSPYAKAYIDGELVSASTFNPRLDLATIQNKSPQPSCLSTWNGTSVEEAEQLCSLNYVGGLAQAHFGLYAPPQLTNLTVFNDDLIISNQFFY